MGNEGRVRGLRATIGLSLKAESGFKFQAIVRRIFEIYYKKKNLKFDMPYSKAGDQKNDGWVSAEKLFYQIYAPEHIKTNFKSSIREKFKRDFCGLVDKVHKQGKWGGEIKEFIFIVNDKDEGLPEDSDGYFKKVVDEVNKDNNITIKAEVKGLSYLLDMLECMDIEDLEWIIDRGNLAKTQGIDTKFKERLILTLQKLSANIAKSTIVKSEKVYKRISPIEKIEINDLEEVREEIEAIIANLDVVDDCIKKINNYAEDYEKFCAVQEDIVSKYREYSKTHHGAELYKKIIEYFISETDETYEIQIKYIVVYIFDKCDIFESKI